MTNRYPNSWYVIRKDDFSEIPLLDSVGTRQYALGYFNALDSFRPSPEYRLVNNKGEIVEIRPAKSPPKV